MGAGHRDCEHRDAPGWAHSFVATYATKACNGFWPDDYFMTGVFPEPIRALPNSQG